MLYLSAFYYFIPEFNTPDSNENLFYYDMILTFIQFTAQYRDSQKGVTNLCQGETLLCLHGTLDDVVTVDNVCLERDQEAPPVGDSLAESVVQVSVFRDHLKVAGRPVEVHPARAKRRQETCKMGTSDTVGNSLVRADFC